MSGVGRGLAPRRHDPHVAARRGTRPVPTNSELRHKLQNRDTSPLVISLEIEPGMVADVLVGVFPYEEGVVDRALFVDYEGATIAVCTAEDLVIHKAIADRPKDWVDIEGIVKRQHGKLDLTYVRKWLREWGEALEKDLVGRFESVRRVLP